jgi:hypothetical protein
MVCPYGADVLALSRINELVVMVVVDDDDAIGCCSCSCFTKNIESLVLGFCDR